MYIICSNIRYLTRWQSGTLKVAYLNMYINLQNIIIHNHNNLL